jgi:hypothetical protein
MSISVLLGGADAPVRGAFSLLGFLAFAASLGNHFSYKYAFEWSFAFSSSGDMFMYCSYLGRRDG